MVQEAWKVVERHQHECEPKRFAVNTEKLAEWKSSPLLLSYYKDVPEHRYMLTVLNGVVVKQCCTRCMLTTQDIIMLGSW